MPGLFARQERFRTVGSTNDVVRRWLADGTPEVCLAVTDHQTAGRGRGDRSWHSPPDAGLLLSLGFRPAWLAPEHVWRLAAIVSLAMADAAEHVADLPAGTVRLKWPNDLVAETGPGVRKLAGVLGETDGLGTSDPRAIIGIGVDVDWSEDAFPEDLAGSMTSISVVAGGSPVDRGALLDAFLSRLEASVVRLRRGAFDAAGWQERQVTTGRSVDVIGPGGDVTTSLALGVDTDSGALIVEDRDAAGGVKRIVVGEIGHLRLATDTVDVAAPAARV